MLIWTVIQSSNPGPLVAMCGGCIVWDLQCGEVAVRGSCHVGELRFRGVLECDKLQFVGIVVRGSCGV